MGTWARSWWCKAPIPRTGCCTTRIGTGAWIPRPAARRAAWRTWLALVPHGRARHRVRHHLGVRRPPDYNKTHKGVPRDRWKRSRARCCSRDYIETGPSTPKISGGGVPAWASGRAAPSPPARFSAGRKNRLNLEIYGTKAGVASDQERPRRAVDWQPATPAPDP